MKEELAFVGSNWSRDAIGPKGTDGTHGTRKCLFYDDSCQALTISRSRRTYRLYLASFDSSSRLTTSRVLWEAKFRENCSVKFEQVFVHYRYGLILKKIQSFVQSFGIIIIKTIKLPRF